MPKYHAPEELRLSNGIPVLLQHLDGAVAATYWWNQVGSADEDKDEAGFAHFLEHMLFKDAAAKDTGKSSTGQTAREIESLGGDINAYTSFDQTVYHVTCAEQHWEKILKAFSQMARPQKFLKKDFVSEREVILEELRKNEDSPGRMLYQELFSLAFKRHPYGKPVIGYVKTLKKATVATLERFYKKNYCAEKMGLILVGPLEDPKRRANLLKQLEETFGSKKYPAAKKPAPPRVRPVEPATRAESPVKRLLFDVQSPSLALSFRVPELDHEDMPALDLLTGILGMGELSRLYQGLFYDNAFVTQISASLYVPKDPGFFTIHAECEKQELLEPTFEGILEHLERIRKEPPTEAEIERIRINLESEKLYATQTADGLASRIGNLRFVSGGLEFDSQYLEALKRVDGDMIQKVAAEYLTADRFCAVVLLPKDSKWDQTQIMQNKVRTRLLPPPALVTKSVSKKQASENALVQIIERPSGLRVAFRENLQSPVVSVTIAALGGTRLETLSGSSNLLGLTWNKGTHAHTAKDIATKVEGSAASLDGFSGRNSTGLQMTCLARDWKNLAPLLTDILIDPIFPEDEVLHSRRVAEDSIRSIDDHTSQLCSKLFLETLFTKHPYGKPIYGTLESLPRIDGKLLRDLHRQWIQPKQLVVSVSGGITHKQLESFIEQIEKDLRSTAGLSAPKLSDEAPLTAPRWIEKSLGREQIHLLVGGLGLRMSDPKRTSLRLLANLLGGQSGRLFIELREKKSLAYTVAPSSMEGLENGYVATYIACSPGKRDEALKGIATVYEQFAKKGPTPAELKRAQEYSLGHRAMELQSDSSIANLYGLELLYRMPIESEKQVAQRIRSVTAKDLRESCQKLFVEPAMVTAQAG